MVINIVLIPALLQNSYAQDAKKNRVRLKADYVKIVDGNTFLNIKATSRIDKKNTVVQNVPITIYNVFYDDEIELGKITTDHKGEGKFILPDLKNIKPDSTSTYHLSVDFAGNDDFRKANRSVSFRNADIKAKLIVKDSINYISATLTDKSNDSVIANEALNVHVQRLFFPLRIGEEFNNTDKNGTILVPIEEGIPGVDGNLTIEVALTDSDEFGTVKALVNAPVGMKIVEESTFDQRTLWGPRNKTPIVILLLTNLLIFGIWGIIVYLFRNLFKIAKLKP